MTFYTTNDQGCITAFAGYKFDDAALETDREIVYGKNGNLYFAGEEPLPSLDEIKAEARDALRRKRVSIEYGGFVLNGQRWESTEKDELRLNSITKLFEMGVEKYEGWKVAEGVYITLTPDLLARASMALMRHYSHCFNIEERKLAQLDALESAEAVQVWMEADIDQGWEAPAEG